MSDTFLAENLSFLRKKEKLSQAALAEKIGLTRNQVASYENRNAEPKTSKLAELARFFDISLNQLIELDLRALPDANLLGANTNIQEEISGLLDDREQIIDRFEGRAQQFRKIIDGFRAFHELKKSGLKETPDALNSMLGDFENLLDVMENLIESNEELIQFLKNISTR